MRFPDLKFRNHWTGYGERIDIISSVHLVQNSGSATNICNIITPITLMTTFSCMFDFHFFFKKADLMIRIVWAVVWLPCFKTLVINHILHCPRMCPYVSQCLSFMPSWCQASCWLAQRGIPGSRQRGPFSNTAPCVDSVQGSVTNGYCTEIVMKFPRSTLNAFTKISQFKTFCQKGGFPLHSYCHTTTWQYMCVSP